MAAKKKNNKVIMWVIIIAFAFYMFNGDTFKGAITGDETLTRTAPATVQPSEIFYVTYTVIDGTPPWGVSITDAVTGGCTFPSEGADYQTVMLSEDGPTKIIEMQAPASGACTFTGDYQFGELAIVALSDDTITIEDTPCTPLWDCTAWSDCVDFEQTRTCTDLNSCGIPPSYDDEHQGCTPYCTPVCIRPADLCVEGSTVSDGCTGDCDGSWAVTKLTSIDDDCDNAVDRIELGDGITAWIAGTFTRTDLGIAIQSWANS